MPRHKGWLGDEFRWNGHLLARLVVDKKAKRAELTVYERDLRNGRLINRTHTEHSWPTKILFQSGVQEIKRGISKSRYA